MSDEPADETHQGRQSLRLEVLLGWGAWGAGVGGGLGRGLHVGQDSESLVGEKFDHVVRDRRLHQDF